MTNQVLYKMTDGTNLTLPPTTLSLLHCIQYKREQSPSQYKPTALFRSNLRFSDFFKVQVGYFTKYMVGHLLPIFYPSAPLWACPDEMLHR